MNRKEYFRKMKALCKQLNTLIPIKTREDKDKLNDLIAKMYDTEYGFTNGAMYWDRDLFIDYNGDDKRMREMVLHSGKVQFEPNEDPTEHPGVVVRYINN